MKFFGIGCEKFAAYGKQQADDLSGGLLSKLAQDSFSGFLGYLMKNYLKIATVAALALASFTLPARHLNAADDDEYSFKVHNASEERITKLLASEDGKDYVKFDIGKGIDPGETVTLNWDKSTNNSRCTWYIKAVFADDSMSKPGKFDFCEEDLVLDF